MDKRAFLRNLVIFFPAGATLAALAGRVSAGDSTAAAPTHSEANTAGAAAGKSPYPDGYDPEAHFYGMGIEVEKCIGCNRCAEACKAENNVPPEPYFFRTWVERYEVMRDGEARVTCISVDPRRVTEPTPEDRDVFRTFFVPKLCNHCANPPCVQVCPVGATFETKDGVVLVDSERCIGCRYCIQACPYGARFFNHRTNTADKCTFCYHRVVQGLMPACVEVCPTQARVFGDLKSKASRLVRFQRMNKINVLKPALNTDPKVFYAQLDGEVR